MLEKNPEKIDWGYLSSNPNAIELLEKNQEKIDWKMLNFNPKGIDLLKANPEKINWIMLSSNHGIFEKYVDYSEIDKIEKYINKNVVEFSVFEKNGKLLKTFEYLIEAQNFVFRHQF